jgi:hypothetical protein
MVVDANNVCLTQRQVPEMALVVPSLGETTMRWSAAGIEDIDVPLSKEAVSRKTVIADIHGKEVHGSLVEDEDVEEWLNDFLPEYKGTKGYRLLRVSAVWPRYIDNRYFVGEASNEVGFADGYSMLLATEPSLAELNTQLEEPVPMNRFRPNIVVNGQDLEVYDEDYWTEIRIGHMSAFVVKACDRCAIPDVNQTTGETGKAVRRALVTRKGVNAHDETNKGVFFAQNLNHVFEPGLTVAIGESVEIEDRSTERNVVLRKAA